MVDGASFTVVVVSYNTRDLLLACLASVERSVEPGDRLVVVDNCSTDGSAEAVRDRFPQIELRVPDKNLGFGAGANVGLRDLGAPYALVLNPDTELGEGALRAFRSHFEDHPRAGVVGGRLVFPNGSFQQSCFRFPGLAQLALDFFPIHHRVGDSRLNGRYPRSSYEHAHQVDHPLGACMALRRAALSEAGLFDESYFMYSEEIDLCYRIKKAGWQVWYTPDATVVHHAGAATRQFRGSMLVELYRSRLRFLAKHRSSTYVSLGRAVIALGIGRGLIGSAWRRVRGEMAADEWRQRLTVYRQVLAL